MDGGIAGGASAAGASAPGAGAAAGGDAAAGASAAGVSAPGTGAVAAGDVAAGAPAAGVWASGAGAARPAAGAGVVAVIGAGVVCARTDTEVTTITTARTPAITPIGRAPMFTQVDVAALPAPRGLATNA